MTTDTDTTAALFVGGRLHGWRIHAGPDYRFDRYRGDDGAPVDPQAGDDEFGFGRLGYRTPRRFYRAVPTGVGFEVALIHATVWPDFERATFDDRQAILLHLRSAPGVVAPQQPDRRASTVAGRGEGGPARRPERRAAA